MAEKRDYTARSVAVPGGRLGRATRLGALAAGVAGRMAVSGGQALASGKRPRARELFLTPSNAMRITDELSKMRGAAMKIGQLLSMEADDFLPPELAQILANLRANAHFMPPKQLKTVLAKEWGPDFLKRFQHFDVRPIAAASIGQVHKAVTRDGQTLAIKVQYPGVRQSIDSDIRNVGALMRLPGLVPKGVDLDGLLEDGRIQLHEEADYAREGAALTDFGARLANDPGFVVPAFRPDLSTESILAMEYIEGVPLDQVEGMAQPVRDDVCARLIALLLRELFAFGTMQTDPNFANYLYQPGTGRIVLLDFGATRVFPADMGAQYMRLLRAGFSQDRPASRSAMQEIGFFDDDTPAHQSGLMLDLFALGMSHLRKPGVYDFGRSTLVSEMRTAGLEIAEERQILPLPPIDALFLQRKIGGMFLLGTRMKARVDLHGILEPYLSDEERLRTAG